MLPRWLSVELGSRAEHGGASAQRGEVKQKEEEERRHTWMQFSKGEAKTDSRGDTQKGKRRKRQHPQDKRTNQERRKKGRVNSKEKKKLGRGSTRRHSRDMRNGRAQARNMEEGNAAHMSSGRQRGGLKQRGGKKKLVGGKNNNEEKHNKGVHITLATHKWEKRIAKPWATKLGERKPVQKRGTAPREQPIKKQKDTNKTGNMQLNKKQRHTTPQTEAITTASKEKINNGQQQRTLNM